MLRNRRLIALDNYLAAPTEIPGCKLWLDFSDPNYLYTNAGTTKVSSDGDLIYRASDKSGNGYYFDQTDEGLRPSYKTGIKNGLSISRHATNKWYLGTGLPTLSAMTAFHVSAPDATNISGTTVPVLIGSFVNYTTTGFILYDRNGYAATNTTYYQLQAKNQIGADWRVNGVDVKPAVSNRPFSFCVCTSRLVYHLGDTSWQVGTSNNNAVTRRYIGDIGEIIIYDTALDRSACKKVEKYLMNKWNF